MSKNPFINAFAASIYIVLVVSLIQFASKIPESNNFFVIPVMMISLFTLSAAVMGYIFCLQPIKMYLDGKKEKAVKLFLQTVVVFAFITLLFWILYFTGIVR